MSRHKPILIVGGGLGGLTTALALAKRGRPSRVLEGAPAFGAIGYGIQFGPNVFHVFNWLGLTEQVLAVADSPAAVLMLDAIDGKELVRIPIGASFRARFKYPYIVIHRIDLHNVLLDACRENDAIELVSDAMVTGFEDRGDSVVVATADNKTFSGEAIVAADGFRSLFREAFVGDGEPVPIGYVALRTIIPIGELRADIPRDCVVLWGGPGLHIVHYPLRHGKEFNIVNVYRTPAHAERLDAAAARAELDHTYRNTHPSMRAMTAVMDLQWRRSIGDRDPVRGWHRGRIVLLGDAAHAPLQSLAQGAGMAIEDGLCLAELIHAADGDFSSAFRHFETARLVRTARVQLESRTLWHAFYHLDEGIERDVRNATVAGWDEAHVFNCLSWLYDGAKFCE
jgi:2-polyprenyl-6-methoxyphenol hydroxylase-like FAD-dependent oxidoreductase